MPGSMRGVSAERIVDGTIEDLPESGDNTSANPWPERKAKIEQQMDPHLAALASTGLVNQNVLTVATASVTTATAAAGTYWAATHGQFGAAFTGAITTLTAANTAVTAAADEWPIVRAAVNKVQELLNQAQTALFGPQDDHVASSSPDVQFA